MPAVSIPAPVGGWNASSSLDKMPETDAVRLVNWIPRAGYVQTRPGYNVHCSGLGGSVETLVPYRGTGGQKLIAAANGRIWDVTTTAPVSLGLGFTNNRWQATNHTNRLILVNGADAPQVYDGATLAAANFSGSPGGFTASTMWGCNTYKGRVYYWAQGAQSFWYAQAGSFQGQMTEFSMRSQLQTGGTLVQMVTWTLDSGEGIDDLAVFIFSTGEVLVYKGDDPGSALAWELIGRFQIGEPLGPRAHAKVGGTEIIITRDGYVDLAVALKDGRYSEQSAYSSKIIRAAKDAANQFGSFTGWEAVLYPAGQLFIVNVPQSPTQSIQHVRETSSGGWCEFTGWNARCFANFNSQLYFGDANGNVCLAFQGVADNGGLITSWAVPAFTALGNRAQRKQMTAASVVSNAVRPAAFAYDALADFNTTLRSTLTDDTGDAGSTWDAADWNTAAWSSGDTDLPVRPAWRNANAVGNSLALSVRVRQKSQQIVWYSTTYQFRNAGAI